MLIVKDNDFLKEKQIYFIITSLHIEHIAILSVKVITDSHLGHTIIFISNFFIKII